MVGPERRGNMGSGKMASCFRLSFCIEEEEEECCDGLVCVFVSVASEAIHFPQCLPIP